MTEVENELFCIIDPEMYQEHKKSNVDKELNVLQYFGAEDMIINCAAQIHDNSRKKKSKEFCFEKNGFKSDNLRYFSAQSVQVSEDLLFSIDDLDFMKRDFPHSTDLFF